MLYATLSKRGSALALAIAISAVAQPLAAQGELDDNGCELTKWWSSNSGKADTEGRNECGGAGTDLTEDLFNDRWVIFPHANADKVYLTWICEKVTGGLNEKTGERITRHWAAVTQSGQVDCGQLEVPIKIWCGPNPRCATY
ncbi:MAG TPA: hypothetical protein VJR89_04350 [Polyangiales bacterium]|nr:hypothetical protein [Polyangiales bacterium]